MSLFNTAIYICIISCVAIYIFFTVRNRLKNIISESLMGYMIIAPATLGFIATTASVVSALAHSSDIVLASSTIEISSGISNITRALGEAFHTTIAGLVASLIIWLVSLKYEHGQNDNPIKSLNKDAPR